MSAADTPAVVIGLNHITFAVRDLTVSFQFYRNTLGCIPIVKWATGAYLQAGELWLALLVDEQHQPSEGYSHIAFSVPSHQFDTLQQVVLDTGVCIWKENRSEGRSLYIKDPDGHKLELHDGNLTSRLTFMKQVQRDDMEWFSS